MSGPIVRRYGFPNFDKIFGERPLEHGIDDPEQVEGQAGESAPAEPKSAPATKPKGQRTSKAKKK
jgi:hypothetical protein